MGAQSEVVRSKDQAAASPERPLPSNIYRFVIAISGAHQLALLALTIVVFLIEIVPLELQRRIVNDIVKHRTFDTLVVLCIAYAGIAVFHGGTKLLLNIYRGWVGERATRDLRRRVEATLASGGAAAHEQESEGIGISIMLAEVEPIGGFVGYGVSEPILQAGILVSVIAYLVHLEPLMAAATLVLFMPQLVFVPLLQSAINRRSGERVKVLRRLSVDLVAHADAMTERKASQFSLIDHMFDLNMGIFRLKFSMNFLMNFGNHLQIISALLIGGWFVLADQLEIGGVVAFISGIARLNDPWGDLVNYFRDATATAVKLRLIIAARDQFAKRIAAASTRLGEISASRS